MVALAQASDEILARESLRVVIPKRFSIPMREIWLLQPRFTDCRQPRAKRLLAHPRFRAAYDFLLLRSQSSETQLATLADWWTKAQTGDLTTPPLEVVKVEAAQPAKKKRRRRRGGRGRNRNREAGEGAAPSADE
jgi:poly(A) polymerase